MRSILTMLKKISKCFICVFSYNPNIPKKYIAKIYLSLRWTIINFPNTPLILQESVYVRSKEESVNSYTISCSSV